MFFHGNDGIHPMPRSSFGNPTSPGCVEIAPDKARIFWKNTHYGTIITVTKAASEVR
jgi:lipoprotein-anchoring transpeptidase ErfK/SrfK